MEFYGAILHTPTNIRAVTARGATAHPSLILELHQGVGSGHLGQEKTLDCLKEWFCWPGLSCDAHNWCKSCISCILLERLLQLPQEGQDEELPLGYCCWVPHVDCSY